VRAKKLVAVDNAVVSMVLNSRVEKSLGTFESRDWTSESVVPIARLRAPGTRFNRVPGRQPLSRLQVSFNFDRETEHNLMRRHPTAELRRAESSFRAAGQEECSSLTKSPCRLAWAVGEMRSFTIGFETGG
jgi:hypothetical protein